MFGDGRESRRRMDGLARALGVDALLLCFLGMLVAAALARDRFRRHLANMAGSQRRFLSKKFTTIEYISLDSGRSGLLKNECHSPSQTCNSVLTPALVSSMSVWHTELTAKS